MRRLFAKVESPNLRWNNPAELRQGCNRLICNAVIDGNIGQNPPVAALETVQELSERDQIGCGNPQQPRRQ